MNLSYYFYVTNSMVILMPFPAVQMEFLLANTAGFDEIIGESNHVRRLFAVRRF